MWRDEEDWNILGAGFWGIGFFIFYLFIIACF